MTLQIDLNSKGNVSFDQQEYRARIENAVTTAALTAGLQFPENAELSVLVADDEVLQSLNAEWRDKDKPTNVLSFPSDDVRPGEEVGIMLGDIVISLETTTREAVLENKSFEDHFSHLIIHGFLHLFGYDHVEEEEAILMESLETRILKELGIADPY